MKYESEDLLIQRIARVARTAPGRRPSDWGLALGMGDDAAILNSRPNKEWVVSCDAFIEGIHFLADIHPADSIGYKALVRATSDLVAMGAEPRLFLLTLSLPRKRTGRWLDEFLGGLNRAARSLSMLLAGGDTTTWASIAVSVTVLGQIDRLAGLDRSKGEKKRAGNAYAGRALSRSGARPGDRIYVSGRLGTAQLGLELVRRGYRQRRNLAPILQPHLYPRLRVELGRWLAVNRVASAMMDLSDGLSSDLARLCRVSRVGAKLWTGRIPTIPDSVRLRLKGLPPGEALLRDRLQMALHGGDDYELLFTVSKRNERRLRSAPDFSALTGIGEITRDRQILLVHSDGLELPLKPAGWDPFRT